ncbi:MAG: hypothetical protein Fur0046_06020 [Cyanobacteria bacterium J069]|nr:MAG: hypothetical protein D6742_13430 [Cyanobacteria bacterium J069]
MSDHSDFFSPRSRYYGAVKPENLVFNANLQEFSNRVTLLCGLETNGKLSPEEAYREIKSLWKQLKHSKKALGIGQSSYDSDGDH